VSVASVGWRLDQQAMFAHGLCIEERYGRHRSGFCLRFTFVVRLGGMASLPKQECANGIVAPSSHSGLLSAPRRQGLWVQVGEWAS
jgi:hypothetical protein